MKKILFLIILTLSQTVLAQTENESNFCSNYKEVTISGGSYHFTQRTPYAQQNGYNAFNYGLGFNCSANKFGNWNDEIQIGVISNSFREPSAIVSYGVLYPTLDWLELGVKAIVASGYNQAPTNFGGFIAAPMLSGKIKVTEDVFINLSLIPSMAASGNYIDGFIYGNIGIRF